MSTKCRHSVDTATWDAGFTQRMKPKETMASKNGDAGPASRKSGTSANKLAV